MSNVLRHILLLAAFLLAACSGQEPSPVKVDGPGQPALWRVEGGKGTVWLFGTVHTLPPDTDWQSPVLGKAMRDADVLVLEASGLDDEKAVADIFAQMAVSHGEPSLTSRVDSSLHPELDALVDKANAPRSVLDKMESWAAALTLASASSADLGVSEGSGVERRLTLRFRADGKPVRGLETISEQFGYFDTLSENDQRKMLDAVLRGAKDNRRNFEAMLTAWMKGDADGVLPDDGDGILASATIREALLDGRNRNWVGKIKTMLAGNETVFVAVGAGHMVGTGGVPALLQSEGYTVTRVQ